jgi:cell division septal protein FtsQ
MKGKPNQRLSNSKVRKQQHLLEVTVRRDKAVSIRNRAVAGFVCKTMLFASLSIAAWIGGKELLRRFLWENPDYFLTDVRVTTDGALTREQIVHAIGVLEGRNIFTVDLARARGEIDRLPQVERAEIQRVLPNRIDIVVTERRPIAWVTARPEEDPTASDKSFLIDVRGVMMRSRTMLPEYYHLPVISGVAVDNFAPGQRVNSFEMQAALELVGRDADNTRWQARNIDLAKGYCLVVTDRNHATITFGLDHIDQQLDRLFRYLDLIEPTKKEIQTVNLMVERNTPIVFADPAADPAGSVGLTASVPPSLPKSSNPPTVKPAIPIAKAVAVNSSNKPAAPRPTPRRKTTAESVRKPFRLH